MGVEPTPYPWQGQVLAVIRIPLGALWHIECPSAGIPTRLSAFSQPFSLNYQSKLVALDGLEPSLAD